MSRQKTVVAVVVLLLAMLFAIPAGAQTWVKIGNENPAWVTNGNQEYDPVLDGLLPGDNNSVIGIYATSHYAIYTGYYTQVRVYGITSTLGATGDFLIDGQVKASGVSWYASPGAQDVLLFDSGTLSAAAHELRLDCGGDWINIDYIMVIPAPDHDPPTPTPMTWATVPYATGDASIAMVATTASDSSGVEYYFDETSGNPGGSDSGWQASPTYADTGLTPSTQYCYQVKARDKSEFLNETAYSTSQCANTNTLDTTPPTPSPMTWQIVPYAITPTVARMVATTASDISGVEYYFDETSGHLGGTDSGWQASTIYTDAGLSPNTLYTYTVRARDKSYTVNQTAASTAKSATTPAEVALAWDWVLKGHRREWRFTTSESAFNGSETFNDIKADLDNVRANGINALLLYCAYAGNPQAWLGCSPVDLYTTPPTSGTPAELQSLIATAHSKGIAVLTYFTLMGLDNTAPFWIQAQQDMGAGLNTHYTRCFAWGDTQGEAAKFKTLDDWTQGVAYSDIAHHWYGTTFGMPAWDFATQDAMDETEAVVDYWGGYGFDGFMWDYPEGMGNSAGETTRSKNKWLLSTLPRYYGAKMVSPEGVEWIYEENGQVGTELFMLGYYKEDTDMNFFLFDEDMDDANTVTKMYTADRTATDFEYRLANSRDAMVAYHTEGGVEDMIIDTANEDMHAQNAAAICGAGVWGDHFYATGDWGRKFWSSSRADKVAAVLNALNSSPAFEGAGARHRLTVSGAGASKKYAAQRIGRSGAQGLLIFQCAPTAENVKVSFTGSTVPIPCSTWDIVKRAPGPSITSSTTTFALAPYGYLLLEIVGTGGSQPTLPPPSGDAFIANIDLYTEVVTPQTSRAVAEITVTDEGGRPVQGATVYVDWLGGYNGSDMGTTNTLGNVRLNTPAVVKAGFTVAVTNVVDQEYTYNPALDVESCDTVDGGPPCPGTQSPYANGESTAAGTVTGDYTDTHASDNVYEAITEVLSAGAPSKRYSYLDHTWTFISSGGTFSVEAYHTANTEGDDFVFAYSTNGTTWTDMLTVTKTSDNNTTQTYIGVPAGAVSVRVRDLNRTAGRKVLDTIYVDYMAIQ